MAGKVDKPFTEYKFESTFSIVTPQTSGSDRSSTQSPKDRIPSPPSASSKPKKHDVGFSFVNVAHPIEARDTASKRAIRSHVARVQHSRVRMSSAVSKKSAKTRTHTRVLQPRPLADRPIVGPPVPPLTYSESSEGDVEEIVSPAVLAKTGRKGSSDTTLKRHDSVATAEDVDLLAEDLADFLTLTDRDEAPTVDLQSRMFLRMLANDRSVMSSRSDPFWSYPVDYHPSYERALNFYVVNIAVDINYLTPPGQEGNMVKQWIPLTMTDPAAFYAIMLMAATAYSCVDAKIAHAINLLALKGKAIAAINEALSDPRRRTNDATIAGILKMASYEAAFGNENFFHAHMDGLQQVMAMKGGFSSLGWDGLLERMILWVDTNASSALGCGWKFEEEKWKPTTLGHPDPDPVHFARCVT